MNIAVSTHAVERYRERVPSAAKMTTEAIRSVIRELVSSAFDSGTVKEHPGHPERKLVPFKVGKEMMHLALGPNETGYPGDIAVIGTLYDRELGKTTVGATIGDLLSDEMKASLASATKAEEDGPKFLVRIGKSSKEIYEAKDDLAIAELLDRRKPRAEDVEVFERRNFSIKQVYVIEKK